VHDLHPDPDSYEPMLVLAVRQSESMGGAAPTERPLDRMRSRVRDASLRLAAQFMTRSGGPLQTEEVRSIANASLTLAAAVIRGLNDCLNTGALGGYVAVNDNRVAQAVLQAGPPSATSDEVSDIDPVIGGWLTETNVHVAPLMLPGTHPDIVVREAFATIGAAAALAAELMRRDSRPQA